MPDDKQHTFSRHSQQFAPRSWSSWARTKWTTAKGRWLLLARTVSTGSWLQSRRRRRWRASTTSITQVCTAVIIAAITMYSLSDYIKRCCLYLLAEAFDNELMYKTLKDIVEGKVVEVPTYDFVTHSRLVGSSEWPLIRNHLTSFPRTFVWELCCLFTGWKTKSRFTQQMWSSSRESWFSTPRKSAICFTWSSLLTQTQMSDCLGEVSLSLANTLYSRYCHSWSIVSPQISVVLRDMSRGRDLEQILTQYTTFVKPAFEEFCLPVRTTSGYQIILQHWPSENSMHDFLLFSPRLRSMQMLSFQGE